MTRRAWVTVFKKEAVENARDRRTLANALLYGPLFGPVLFAAILAFVSAKELEKWEKPLELPVVGREHAPNLVRFLEQQSVLIKPTPEDAEAAVRAQDADMVLRLAPEFGEAFRSGRPAPVDLLFDSSRQEAQKSVGRADALLQQYSRQIGLLRLQVRGINPEVAQAVTVQRRDLSTPQSRAGLILAVLPYFLILSSFLGGMYLAIDTTTGERERQSLEPLLTNPVSREQIMLGKLVATTLYALLSSLISIAAFAVSIRFVPPGALGFELSLSWSAAALIGLIVAPVALLAATLQTIVAAFARTYREAMTYLQFLIIVPMIPSILIMLNPTKPVLAMYATPLMGQSLLINQLVRGDVLSVTHVLVAVSGTLFLALMCGFIATRLYHRESLAVAT
jgi:sodium transport system permease protein